MALLLSSNTFLRAYMNTSGICISIALLASLKQGSPRVLTMATRVGNLGHQFSGKLTPRLYCQPCRLAHNGCCFTHGRSAALLCCRCQIANWAAGSGGWSGEFSTHGRSRSLLPWADLFVLLQAYSLRQGRPVSDADYAPGRTRYENTGQLQLLRKSYQYGTPTNSPTLGSSRSNQTSTQQVDVQELTQQLKIPLYKQLIGNTAMVDLSSLSANPQVYS